MVPDSLTPMKVEESEVPQLGSVGGFRLRSNDVGIFLSTNDLSTILNLDEGKCSLKASNKCKRSYEPNQHFSQQQGNKDTLGKGNGRKQ